MESRLKNETKQEIVNKKKHKNKKYNRKKKVVEKFFVT